MILAQKGDNASAIDDASVMRVDARDNADEVENTTMECRYNYLRLLMYAN
jgi:hypothetical protein